MAEAALSKTQRKNAKKRAKEKENAGDDKPPPQTTDAPLEPCYRQIYELSKEIVARRMKLGGEDPPNEEEWQQVWTYMPTIVHALHRTVQKRRELTESGDQIVDWELRWIGRTEFNDELNENPSESPLSIGEATVPPSLGTVKRPLGVRGSGRPLGGSDIPAAKHSGTVSTALQACPDAKVGPVEHPDSSGGNEQLKGLWQLAQSQAESKVLQAPGGVSEEHIHQMTVEIFRKLKKKDKSREKARAKRITGFGSKSSMVAEV